MNADSLSAVSRYKDVLKKLGDREPSTVTEAKAVIENIRVKKGHLDKKTLQELSVISDESRQNILSIINEKRETEAAFTKSISEQLYTSKYRFLYELVQNAHDSEFSLADRVGQLPFLKFTVRPGVFIVDTNEDGFTRRDVNAVCATGKSSKKASASDDQIGEKGFGFKSVFAVADQVHIQSGVWSFRFQHRHNGDGLGMVTPLDAPALILPAGVTTRITLNLSASAVREYQRLLDALADMPDTTIFFLEKLRKIHVTAEQLDSQVVSTVICKQGYLSKSGTMKVPFRPLELKEGVCQVQYQTITFHRLYQADSLEELRVADYQQNRRYGNESHDIDITRTITRSAGQAETTETEESAYYVFSHTVEDMPRDLRRENRSTAKIYLAFPIDKHTGQPRLSGLGQHIFAYLPLQRLSQMPFLIQSDFITNANRESAVDCTWNDAIRDGIVKAFDTAISTFATAKHPLRYSWLDYLPTDPINGFWKHLYPSIEKALQTMFVLQTWQGRCFELPITLNRLRSCDLHKGQPLFRDLQDEVYLAPEYHTRHHAVLEDLGVFVLSRSQILTRAEADLVRLDSFVKTKASDDTWHQSLATMLHRILRSGHAEDLNRIRRMGIIPLTNKNQWTGAPGISTGGIKNIYFPTTDGVAIPTDVSLHLVEGVAASNAARRKLFIAMGVELCPKATVFAHIEASHRRLSFSRPHDHFRYLFNFHPQPESIKEWLIMDTSSGRAKKMFTPPLYFPSHRKYDTYNILPSSFRSNLNDIAVFIPQDTIDLESPDVRRLNLSWTDWLQKVTGARYHPPLTRSLGLFGGSNFGRNRGGDPEYGLSKVLSTVLEHNPQVFVGILQAHWTEYQSEAVRILPQLKACKVPGESGALLALNSTFLPTVAIRSRLRSLGAEPGFPLLKLPCSLDEFTERDWYFLQELGVRSAIDIEFYKLILGLMMESTWATKERVLNVYNDVSRLITLPEHAQLKTLFQSRRLIAFEERHGVLKWTTPSECVWDGPNFMTTKVVLKYHYGEEANLKTFFNVILDIRNFNFDDILKELDHRRDGGAWPTSEALQVYQFLEATVQTDAQWQSIREAFGQRKLIMGAGGQWHTLQYCLWNSPFSLAEYEDLSTAYPTLKTFFVNHLKVKNANLVMLTNELGRMAQEDEPPISDIRRRLVDVGRMIAKSAIDSKLSRALDKLKDVKFLPKKTTNGDSELVGVDDDFAILDHARFGDRFSDESVLLDFALDEVQILDTMFQYLGLAKRYLSVGVKEVSTVGEGARQSEELAHNLQVKAYALYSCATKFKSVKALRGDTELFEQLSCAQIYTTDNISTNLVLTFASGQQLSVESDRLALHHKVVEGQLKVYVPEDPRLRAVCYRSQVPSFLATFLGAAPAGTLAVSEILRNDARILDDILLEHDIPHVEWIERPVIGDTLLPTNDGASTPTPSNRPITPSRRLSTASTVVETPVTPDATPTRSERTTPTLFRDEIAPATSTPRHYERLVEQVLQSAQRASYRQQRSDPGNAAIRNAPPASDRPHVNFDHATTFGDRDANEMAHDRRIGAAGEAYVFEVLSNIDLPNFSRDNWRSTIRGDVRAHARFADMRDWIGRETADLVYTDRTGDLTQYLRNNCSGGFPVGISRERDFAAQPIEYFLEVKTTTSTCQTRFFMSGSQYNRMQNMAVTIFGSSTKVYVLLRVFNLSSGDVGMKIFVDPLRLRGQHVDFEVGTWFCKTREGA